MRLLFCEMPKILENTLRFLYVGNQRFPNISQKPHATIEYE